MNDDRKQVAFEDAVGLLPDRDEIHTFRGGSGILIGADWSRAALLSAMQKAPEIELTGPVAQSMNHGIAILDEMGWLYIETVKP